VLHRFLGIEAARPDAVALLLWAMDPDADPRLAQLPAPARIDVMRWLGETAGVAGEMVLGCVDAGRTADALPLGLVCGVVFAQDGEGQASLGQAAIRLERFVNGKHVGAFKQANHINIVFLSNEGQPLPLDNDDRRHLVVWTPPQREITYYDAIQEEIHAGGVAALYHHLLNLDLDGWRPHQRPPMTQAKKDLVEVSRSSEDLFLREIEAKESGLPLCPCLSDDLYKAYDRWCRSNGHKHAANSARFLNCVARRPGWQKVRARILVGASSLQRTVLLPPEALLEGTSNVQGPTESESIWYGRCAELFGEAVREGAKAVPWAV
jgi:hypothetical protein